jgi:hypothetical protein
MTKSGSEIVEIFEAFNLAGTAWSAAELGRVRCEDGRPLGSDPRSARATRWRRRESRDWSTDFVPKVQTLVDRSKARSGPEAAQRRGRGLWTGSWTESADNPSAMSVTSAMTDAIGAARARAARKRASRNASLVGFRLAVALSFLHILARRGVAKRRWF